MSKNDLQQKQLEFKMLVNQFQQLQQQSSNLEEHASELVKLKENISILEKEETPKEILIPFGAGIFFKGTIIDNKNAVLNVGAKVYIDKTTENVKNSIQTQIKEVGSVINKINEQTEELMAKIEDLQKDLKE